jgi:ribulose-5-phosphate 4-epimerase/fuculose-1-phosphate aldolase
MTALTTSAALSETHAREEMCRVGKSLFDRGYVHATAGNISVRLDHGFLITPTDACLGFLDPAKLSLLDAQGHHISGDNPSKTIALHRRIYDASVAFDPHTRCVIHTHSTHCVALTLANKDQTAIRSSFAVTQELLPPITPYFVMKVGHVPVINYHRPGAVEAAEAVARTITKYGEQGTPIRAVMLSRLGPNVWHHAPASAMAVLEELEETAKLMYQATHPVTPLTQKQIQELRETFGAKW